MKEVCSGRKVRKEEERNEGEEGGRVEKRRGG
jgi:hypothetical protein